MSSSSDKTKIQKEILDQVLKLSEKRREEAARKEKLKQDTRKRLSSLKSQQKSGGKYEPSANFYKVFSEIVGEDTRTKKVVQRSKEEKAEPVTRHPKKISDASQKMQKTEKQEKKMEETKGSAPLSVFETLSYRTKDEDTGEPVNQELNKEPDLSKEIEKTEIKAEKTDDTKSSAPLSVFERFSRRKKEEEPS